jgi:hypothetical protein
MQILALYPPSGSNPGNEYDNATSREIAKIVGDQKFEWNDLYPYAPVANKNVKQLRLRQLLDTGRVPARPSNP